MSMMDEFQAHTGIERMGEWGGIVKYGNDKSQVVLFFLRAVHNKARSVQEGRPVYEDKTFVRIHPPGERLNIVEREANDTDKHRWPMQWHQYMQNKPQIVDGTPVEMLFPAQPSIAAALQASGVHTVEQLAELSANAIENVGMGCQQWVNDATRYLQVANKGVKASELKKLLEDRDREIASQNHKISLLETELRHLRDRASNAVTADDVAMMLANQGGGGKRGVFVGGNKLPKSFDAQSAQIAANHPTRDIANSRNAAKAKRPRARINK